MRIKQKTKSIISAILCIAVILGCGAGAIAIFGTKTMNVNPSFSAGALDQNGQYVASETALYTKDLVACKGISVVPDFESDTEYQIFWYNKDGKFLGFEAATTEAFEGKTPSIAKYCRIVLTPNLEDEIAELKEKDEEAEFKFTIFNIHTFADDINIKVNRDQTYSPVNLVESAKSNIADGADSVKGITDAYTFIKNATLKGYSGSGDESTLVSFSTALQSVTVEGQENDSFNGYAVIKLWCGNVKAYEFIFEDIPEDMTYYVYYYDTEGTPITPAEKLEPEANSSYIINVAEGAQYICVNVVPEDLIKGGESVPFIINEYLWNSYSAQ